MEEKDLNSKMTEPERREMIARFQKLAKAINKYDPGYEKLIDIERVRGFNSKNITYEKLMELPSDDPLWITLSRVYFNEPQYQRIIMYYATLFLDYYYVSPVDILLFFI